MKKNYLKPEMEIISLITTEKITSEDYADGEIGVGSNEYDL